MNKEQIIDEVYKNYLNEWTFEKYPNDGSVYSVEPIKVKEHSKEQFVYRCKTDNEFSERWGLKIEERELSDKERQKWVIENIDWVKNSDDQEHEANKYLYRGYPLIYGNTVPTKLITLEHNQEKIYIYE